MQYTLFDDPDDQRSPAELGRIEKSFLEFHARNPQVYRILVEETWKLYKTGTRRTSIKLLWERIRWDIPLDIKPEDVNPDKRKRFKLCNDYHALYARLIMRDNPELRGMFDTRTLRSTLRSKAGITS